MRRGFGAPRSPHAVCAALLLAGGCVFQDDASPKGRNSPLPRTAREDALWWAKDSTARMAGLTGAELLPDTAEAVFEPCVGANNETADDRPVHPLLLRLLARPGHYEVTSYREFKSAFIVSGVAGPEQEKRLPGGGGDGRLRQGEATTLLLRCTHSLPAPAQSQATAVLIPRPLVTAAANTHDLRCLPRTSQQ